MNARVLLPAAILQLGAAQLSPAQQLPGATALSAAQVADSLAAIRELERRLRSAPRDAAVWHRIGMIAWALSDRAQAPNSPRGLNALSLARMADTSLRIAAELAPQNAHYRLAVGKMLLYRSGAALTRFASYGQFERALEIARLAADTVTHAEAAIEFGRVYWRRYDGLAHRRIATEAGGLVRSLADAMLPIAKASTEQIDPTGSGPVSAREAASATQRAGQAQTTSGGVVRLEPMSAEAFQVRRDVTLQTAIDAILSHSQALPAGVSGHADYKRADSLFREAYRVAPGSPRAFHSVAMALAAEAQWTDLLTFSRAHLSAFADHATAWLVFGLALHRDGQTFDAGRAFDSALARLPRAERERLDRLERVIRRSEALQLAGASEDRKTGFASAFWRIADPLWSRPGNEARAEFLSRVTYAELRWTVPELGVRGADSDRGDAFIRYGPPGVIAQFGPTPESEGAAATTIWIYDWGLMLVFAGAPSYATAQIPFADRAWVEALADAQPVRWESALPTTIDSLEVSIARFRADHDLVGLLIAARAPPDSTATVDGSTIRNDIWVLDGYSQLLLRDSAVVPASAVWTWRTDVARGLVLYRIESGGDGASTPGRAAATVEVGHDPVRGFPASGFGVSDLVLATRAESRALALRRWHDLSIAPVMGAVATGAAVYVVWEAYELSVRDALASYDVTLTMTRVRGIAGRIAASIRGALADIARIETAEDRVVVRFDRSVPHAAAVVDLFELDLGATPAGDYRVTLSITDRSSGRTASRSISLAVR